LHVVQIKHVYSLHLEYEPECVAKNAAIDILITEPQRIAVELKYSTVAFRHEQISLRGHPADVARYGVVLDVRRLEAVVTAGQAARGVSIFITNNKRLWSLNEGRPRNCDHFSLHEGREPGGSMSWRDTAGADTFKRYPVPVTLKSRYLCKWFDYTDLAVGNGLFRCLVTEVARTSLEESLRTTDRE
jgi:hypothetical protein